MVGLLGKKLGMTHVYDENGKATSVTVLELGPNFVTAVMTEERNGYSAVQLSYEPLRDKLVTKARSGHFKRAGLDKSFRHMREVRTDDVSSFSLGMKLSVNNFELGDYVDVISRSIGKGFQGVVKRHNFAGGPGSHGAKFGREGGSIGQSAFPSRVVKGMKMAGQMGNVQVTVQNLKVMKIDELNNLIVVSGAVPGAEQGLVFLRQAIKRGSKRGWVLTSKQNDASKDKVSEAASESDVVKPESEEV